MFRRQPLNTSVQLDTRGHVVPVHHHSQKLTYVSTLHITYISDYNPQSMDEPISY